MYMQCTASIDGVEQESFPETLSYSSGNIDYSMYNHNVPFNKF